MAADEHKIHYVIIVGNNSQDHVYLRKVLNKMLPQAIVESLYCNAEAISFLQHHCLKPDLILVEQHALMIDGIALIPFIRHVADLKTVPVILLGDEAEEHCDFALSETGADAYFYRSYPQNSVDWLARSLQVKWRQCLRAAS